MSSNPSAEQETYRLIITRRGGSEVLLAPRGDGWQLPRVTVRPRQRLAQELTGAARKRWELECYCLFVPRLARHNENAAAVHHAVMESCVQNGPPPAGMHWMLRTATTGKITLGDNDREDVERSFHEMARYVAEPHTGPFGRPGWLKELFAWVEATLSPLGLQVTGAFEQLSVGPTFSLLRVETTGQAVWFKATGEPNRHELQVITTLTRLFHGYVPQLLAVHSSWNGWLSWEVAGSTLDNLDDSGAWERAAETLAQLQIASIGKPEELLQNGSKDLRLSRLRQEIDAFFAAMSERMEAQEKLTPAPLMRSDLNLVRDALIEALDRLEEVDLPDSLGHLDCNPGNIVVSAQRCVFLDWAESCVANPLITFSYLREHFRRRTAAANRAEARITAAYLRPWKALFPRADLERGISLSSLTAVFAYAVRANEDRSEAHGDPAHAGYLRSLTRRMHREALRLQERGESCVC